MPVRMNPVVRTPTFALSCLGSCLGSYLGSCFGHWGRPLLCAAAMGTMLAAGGAALAGSAASQDQMIADIKDLVKIQTYREDGNEAQVRANLKQIQDIFKAKMDQFNQSSPIHKINFFEWKSVDEAYWVFGFRVGTGARKTSILAHLDTVPPGNMDWRPFEPREETRIYHGAPTDFLIGRGTIDDKGPAVVAFKVLTDAITGVADNPDAFKQAAVEVLFDTSEETDMSTPHFYAANPDAKPTLGVVFDAFWCVRAEKGVERVTFSINPADFTAPPANALRIEDLASAPGAMNMIPTSATARITSNDSAALDNFAANVANLYHTFAFDDPNYHPADLVVSREGSTVVLTTLVSGAQHGSAPQENRTNGANPVVSLTNFLAGLVDRGTLANNGYGELSRFVRWSFGTYALGESHPNLLLRYDPVFQNGNGTSFALTQIYTKDGLITLGLDIRYAVGHHGTGWDGAQGLMTGNSLFPSVFNQLVQQYKANGGATVAFNTRTAYGPDIRDPNNPNLFRVNAAYRSMMGSNCPMYATGGGTDAKGNLELVAAGALFTDNMGPPINFHGLDEGAPIVDLVNSAGILLKLVQQDLPAASGKNATVPHREPMSGRMHSH